MMIKMHENATDENVKGVIEQIPQGYRHCVQKLSKKKIIWIEDHGRGQQPDREIFKKLPGVEYIGTIRISLNSDLLVSTAAS